MTETRSEALRVVTLTPRPLTPASFAEFGTVVGPDRFVLTSTEFPFFTNVATLQPDDQPITYVNRHHDHHQIFATFDGNPMIVVVASPQLSGEALRPEDVQAFVTDGSTAIVFHVDTWHLAPRAVGTEPIRALNVQAINNHVHTERIELGPTYGCVIALDVPRLDALRQQIRESRAKLEAAVAALSPTQLAAPGPDGWSPKDHLAHVAAWEESLIATLEGHDRRPALGLAPSVPWDIDAINADIFRRYQDRPPAEVLASFRETHARTLAALDRLTDADLLRPWSHYQPSVPMPEVRPILDWIKGDTWEHYEEHATTIRGQF
jgi:uncharacterized protein (TIGR03083 family)